MSRFYGSVCIERKDLVGVMSKDTLQTLKQWQNASGIMCL